MSPGSITILLKREGADNRWCLFFVAQNMVSALSRNHCPLYAGMPQLSACMDVNGNLQPRKSIFKGVRIIRIRMSCFKSKNEIENLQGFILKKRALRTASIKQDKRPGSLYPVWW